MYLSSLIVLEFSCNFDIMGGGECNVHLQISAKMFLMKVKLNPVFLFLFSYVEVCAYRVDIIDEGPWMAVLVLEM